MNKGVGVDYEGQGRWRQIGKALARSLMTHQPDRTGAEGVRRVSLGEGDFPLSEAQQQLWFTEQANAQSAFWVVPLPFRLKGKLNPEALERALAHVVKRHEALRTCFVQEPGTAMPVQRVQKEVALSLTRRDLTSDVVRQGAEAVIHHICHEELQKPFELAHAPLLRAVLATLSANDYLLVLVGHHIIGDLWSFSIVAKELIEAYGLLAQGAVLPALPVPWQQVDFVEYHRRPEQVARRERQLESWKKTLKGAPTALELPLDAPRPPRQTFRASRIPVTLDRQWVTSLERFGQTQGVSLFMLCLTAFHALLHRYTGQSSLLVGTPAANRTVPEAEQVVGLFMNTVVIRSEITAATTFREMLTQIRGRSLEAFSNQEVTFTQVVNAVATVRDPSRSPLFQALFDLQHVPLARFELPELTFEGVIHFDDVAMTDLALSFIPANGGLAGLLFFNVDLFSPETAAQLGRHYVTLLQAAMAHPEMPVSRLPLLDAEDERRLSVLRGNATGLPATDVVQLFEAQVKRTPDAEAVRYAGRSLTYRQLDEAANGLAELLQHLGAGPDVAVPVLAERCLELPIAALGILKSGAAWAPVDPSYPNARIQQLFHRLRPCVVLGQQSLLAGLSPQTMGAAPKVDLARLPPSSPLPPRRNVWGGSLCYVVFTSGSTGEPKGVQCTHEAVVNLVTEEMKTFAIGPGARVLQCAALGFDAAVEELLTTLTSGATLVLAHRDELLPGPGLAGRVHADAITHLNLTPSVLALQSPEGLSTVRVVVAGGETCPPAVVEAWAPGRAFFNVCAPTETTAVSMIAACVPDGRPPPVGLPIANTQIYLLDEQGQRVPPGVMGEMCIGGVGVSRGYLGSAEKTAERFLPDPFSGVPGARLYRTGDLARLLSNGQLTIVGRADEQVKIRGFRIELREVEAVLSRHPRVAEAVAASVEDGQGTRRLVAYVVPRAPDLSASQLRDHVQASLPEFMTPSAFVMLEALPLSPNGKVDRAALPDPELGLLRAGYVAPRSALETLVAGLWADLLALPQVGVQENFFELGGHSLLVSQLSVRVEEVLGLHLPVRVVFENLTVEELCGAMGKLDASADLESLAQQVLRVSQMSEAELDAALSDSEKTGPA